MQTITVFAYEPVTPQRIDLSTIESLLKNKNLLNLLAQNYDEFEPDYSGDPFGDTEQEEVEFNDPFADAKEPEASEPTTSVSKSNVSSECEEGIRHCDQNSVWVCSGGKFIEKTKCVGDTPRCIDLQHLNTALCTPPEDHSLEEGYTCGDGIVGQYEECDDGNDNDLDDCTSVCTKAKCGDGIEQDAEECDPPTYPYCLANCTIGSAPAGCGISEVDYLLNPNKKLTSKKLEVVFKSLKNCYEAYISQSSNVLDQYPKQDSHTLEGSWKTRIESNKQFDVYISERLEQGAKLDERFRRAKNVINQITPSKPSLVKVSSSEVEGKLEILNDWQVKVEGVHTFTSYVQNLNFEDYYDKVSPVVKEALALKKQVDDIERKRDEELAKNGFITSRLSNEDVEKIVEAKYRLLSEIETLNDVIKEEVKLTVDHKNSLDFPEFDFTVQSVEEDVENYLRSLLKDLSEAESALNGIDIGTSCSINEILRSWGVRDSDVVSKIEENYSEQQLKQIDSRIVLSKALPQELCEEEKLIFCESEIDTVELANLLASDTSPSEWSAKYRSLLPTLAANDSDGVKLTLPELKVRELISERVKRLEENAKDLRFYTNVQRERFKNLINEVSNSRNFFNEFVTIVNNSVEFAGRIPSQYPVIYNHLCGEAEIYDLPSSQSREISDAHLELLLNSEKNIDNLKYAIEIDERELFQLALALLAYKHGGVSCDSPQKRNKQIFNVWVNAYGNELDELSPYYTQLLGRAWKELNIDGYSDKLPAGSFYKNLRNNEMQKALEVLLSYDKPVFDNIYGGDIDQTLITFLASDPSMKFISEIALTYFENATRIQQLLVAGTVGVNSAEYIKYARDRALEMEHALNKFRSIQGGQSVAKIRNIIAFYKKHDNEVAKRFYPEFTKAIDRIEQSINYMEREHDVDAVIKMIRSDDFRPDTWANFAQYKLPEILAMIAFGVLGGISCVVLVPTGVGAIACMAILGATFGMLGSRAFVEARYQLLGIGLGADFFQYLRGEYVLDENGKPVQMEFVDDFLTPLIKEFGTQVVISAGAIGGGKVILAGFGPSLRYTILLSRYLRTIKKLSKYKASLKVHKLKDKLVENSVILKHLEKASQLSRRSLDGGSQERALMRHFMKHYFYEFSEELGQEGLLEPTVDHSLTGVFESLDLQLGGIERIIGPLVSSLVEGISFRGGANINTLHYNHVQREALIASLERNGFIIEEGNDGEFFATLRDRHGLLDEMQLNFIPEIVADVDVSEIISAEDFQSLVELTDGNVEIVLSESLPYWANARTTVTQRGEERLVVIEVSRIIFDGLSSEDETVRRDVAKILHEEIKHAHDPVIDPNGLCGGFDHYVALRIFRELTARAASEGKDGNREEKLSIGEDLKQIKSLIDNGDYASAKELAIKLLASRYGIRAAKKYIEVIENNYNNNINSDEIVENDFNIDLQDIEEFKKFVVEGLHLIRDKKYKEASAHFNNKEFARKYNLIISILDGKLDSGFDGHYDPSGIICIPSIVAEPDDGRRAIGAAEEWIHALQHLSGDFNNFGLISTLSAALKLLTVEDLSYVIEEFSREGYLKGRTPEQILAFLLIEADAAQFFIDHGIEGIHIGLNHFERGIVLYIAKKVLARSSKDSSTTQPDSQNDTNEITETNYNVETSLETVLSLKEYIAEGLSYIRNGNLNAAIKHFRDIDKAKEFGLTLRLDGQSRYVDVIDDVYEYSYNISLPLDGTKQGRWTYIIDKNEIVLGNVSISTENAPEIHRALLYEICLAYAEEWAHALQHAAAKYSGKGNTKGLSYISSLQYVLSQITEEDLMFYIEYYISKDSSKEFNESTVKAMLATLLAEFDVGVFFQDNGIVLSTVFNARYSRRSIRSIVKRVANELDKNKDLSAAENDDFELESIDSNIDPSIYDTDIDEDFEEEANPERNISDVQTSSQNDTNEVTEINYNVEFEEGPVRDLYDFIVEGLELIKKGNYQGAINHFNDKEMAAKYDLTLVEYDGELVHGIRVLSSDEFAALLDQDVKNKHDPGFKPSKKLLVLPVNLLGDDVEISSGFLDLYLLDRALTSAEEWTHLLQVLSGEKNQYSCLSWLKKFVGYMSVSDLEYYVNLHRNGKLKDYTDEQILERLLIEADIFEFFAEHGVSIPDYIYQFYSRKEVVITVSRKSLSLSDDEGNLKQDEKPSITDTTYEFIEEVPALDKEIVDLGDENELDLEDQNDLVDLSGDDELD